MVARASLNAHSKKLPGGRLFYWLLPIVCGCVSVGQEENRTMTPCYQASYLGVVVSRYRGVMVSAIKSFEDFIKHAVFSVLAVIFNKKIDSNPSDLIFVRAYSLA